MIVRRQAPPLEAIEAFILASRSSSFREAADSLALSPSAFSRRIGALEAFVGVPLFVRERGTAVLSPTGERYLRTIEPAIDAIRRATVDLQAERGGTALRLILPQSFAMAWFIPNLPSYQREYPDSRIELRVGRSAAGLKRGHADLAILADASGPSDMPFVRLTDLDAIAVSAAALADGSPIPQSLNGLAHYPRLAVYQPAGIWDRWLHGVRYDGPPLEPPTYYEAHFLMIEAAAAGLGVALTAPILAAWHLADGRLVQLFPQTAPMGIAYRLVYADERVRRRPDVARLTQWLMDGLAA